MEEECKGGVEIQPMSQERVHGGGKQGRASVNCSPDSSGIHFLIGVIDTSLLFWCCSVYPKRPFKIPIPNLLVIGGGSKPDSEDEERCRQTQKIVEQIDWNCDLKTNFAERNLGCFKRVSSGLDWVCLNRLKRQSF